ncbi:hypothetical protein DID76_00180 [Candidatus Marinamargulisbacteria bacterium SCGC AG-414-C22]|nr:hypothetical protein DID76_00180 [Candidatus Marinamargulisbacteria bacterium SCGC AG-414-C22]
MVSSKKVNPKVNHGTKTKIHKKKSSLNLPISNFQESSPKDRFNLLKDLPTKTKLESTNSTLFKVNVQKSLPKDRFNLLKDLPTKTDHSDKLDNTAAQNIASNDQITDLKQTKQNELNSDASDHDFSSWNKKSVWAGSTSAESDRDYIGQGTKGNGDVNRKGSQNQKELTTKFKNLKEQAPIMNLEESIQNTHGGHDKKGIPDPPQCRKLTNNLRQNAMSLLKSNGHNWFKTLDTLNQHAKNNPKDKNFCAQLKYDIRQLQTDLMAEMDKAIDGDYDAINETEMVRVKNEMCGEIFDGREAGTVFDTNLYTGHMALAKGLNFNNRKTKERWLDQNQENSMIKRAQQYDTVSDTPKASWDEYVEKQLEGLPDDKQAKLQKQYNRAWSRKETRTNNIKKEIATIMKTRSKAADIDQKYFNQEVELSAMNRLYEKNLEKVEEKMKDLDIKSKTLDIAREMGESYLIQESEIALQEAQADVIEAQSNALLYANEPYYAQVTIVNIVAGTQMEMPDNFMPGEPEEQRTEAWQTKLETDFTALTVDEGKVIASNENFADLLKGKHEWPYSGHHVNADSKPADNVNYHFTKASKYAHRALVLLPEPKGDGIKKDAFLTKANNMLKTIDIIYAVRQGPPGTEFKTEDGKTFNDSIEVMQNSKELQEYADEKGLDLKTMEPTKLADTFHEFMESLEAESKKHF